MKIVITNIVMLNAGDAAILKAMIMGLKKKFGPDTEIVVYDSQAEGARKYYPDLDIKEQLQSVLKDISEGDEHESVLDKITRKVQNKRFPFAFELLERGKESVARGLMPARVRAIFDDYASADLILGTGGTYIVENYSIERKYQELVFELAAGKPVALFTQSMGPFTEPHNRKMLSKVFPKLALILLRDEASLEYCKSVNSADNMMVSADAVFVTANENELAEAGSATTLKPKQVAVSVRHWPFFKNEETETGMKRYLSAVQSATEHLIDAYGANVTFISTCQGIPEYWVDDAKVAQQVYDALDPKYQARTTVNSDFHDPFVLQDKLADFDLVVATRLHVAILSLTRGTPVLPISYEFKTNELFRRFGVSQYVSDIDTVTGETLVQKLDAFVNQYSEFGKQLFDGVDEQYREALASFDALDDALKANKAT